MTATNAVPAAQYLRMSTEHQQYSLENQSTAIEAYANLHGFEVVQTYSDSAKSGVSLKNRSGLQQLLRDVVSGSPGYRVILVYDVSRWGRFQDTDESAHYEFVCKSAGVPIHYCAETFANDGTLPSLIMKALKRTMAGEYSRELGVKVLSGQKRLARLGFKQGGRAGYGLRRLLVTPERTPKQLLKSGERKSIATDRVILVPGDPVEVAWVKNIFRMFVFEKRTVYSIVRELNRLGVGYLEHSKWDYAGVRSVLTHAKYAGCNVFGRTSGKLHTPAVRLPKTDWVLTPNAFEPIIDQATFETAQALLQARTICKSDEQILQALRELLTAKGRLSLQLIKDCDALPSPSTFRTRFGGLRPAYALIGYDCPAQFGPSDMRKRIFALRAELFARIAESDAANIAIVQRGGRYRKRLRLRNGVVVSVIVVRAMRAWKDTVRWLVDPPQKERHLITLVARLNEENTAFMDFHVFPRIERRTRRRLLLRDPWLKSGVRVTTLSRICEAVSDARISTR
jgi:DNA invertase Pin-like site-specific DNA recombinase